MWCASALRADTFNKLVKFNRRVLFVLVLLLPAMKSVSSLRCWRSLTEHAESAIVVRKEGDHDEESARPAASALRAGVCDGREWNRTFGGRADHTIADRAERAGSVRTAGAGVR